MPAFPSLSINPSWPLDPDGEIEDATLRSPFEGGYELTRQKFTRTRRNWGVQYSTLNQTDKDALATFEKDTVKGGADSFTWTHPKTATVYTVRFKEPVKYAYVTVGLYTASFMLREV